MNTLGLTETITRLFAALPLLERIDLIVADACARGLVIDGISLDAADFDTFRIEAETHTLISVDGDGGSFRDHLVRRRLGGESQIEATMPNGLRMGLSICPDVRMIWKTTGPPCVAVAASTGQTASE